MTHRCAGPDIFHIKFVLAFKCRPAELAHDWTLATFALLAQETLTHTKVSLDLLQGY